MACKVYGLGARTIFTSFSREERRTWLQRREELTLSAVGSRDPCRRPCPCKAPQGHRREVSLSLLPVFEGLGADEGQQHGTDLASPTVSGVWQQPKRVLGLVGARLVNKQTYQWTEVG